VCKNGWRRSIKLNRRSHRTDIHSHTHGRNMCNTHSGMKRKATLDTARLIHKYLTIFLLLLYFLISSQLRRTLTLSCSRFYFFLALCAKRFSFIVCPIYISQRLFLFLFAKERAAAAAVVWEREEKAAAA
jgi:hypothetical protein